MWSKKRCLNVMYSLFHCRKVFEVQTYIKIRWILPTTNSVSRFTWKLRLIDYRRPWSPRVYEKLGRGNFVYRHKWSWVVLLVAGLLLRFSFLLLGGTCQSFPGGELAKPDSCEISESSWNQIFCSHWQHSLSPGTLRLYVSVTLLYIYTNQYMFDFMLTGNI